MQRTATSVPDLVSVEELDRKIFRCDYSYSTARDKVRVAHAVAELPLIAGALASGAGSGSAAIGSGSGTCRCRGLFPMSLSQLWICAKGLSSRCPAAGRWNEKRAAGRDRPPS